MKLSRILLLPLALAFLTGCGNTDNAAPLVIDHTDVDASVIPASVIAQIKGLDVYFEHASVGGRITGGPIQYVRDYLGGLDFLASANARYAYVHEHISDDGSGPIDTTWIDNNDGLLDNMRDNPGLSAKISWFHDRMTSSNFASHFDVAMFKLCWIDTDGTAQQAFDQAKTVMESLEASYPHTTFVWWTQPIIGQDTSKQADNKRRDDYNALVRNYCGVNKKYLFDIADIECHAPGGTVHKDAIGNYYVDASYLSDEGHPNEAGATRLANAWWVLMARICGWNG